MAAVELIAVSPEAAAAIIRGEAPPGVTVPDDYPTEFSEGVAKSAGGGEGSTGGPHFIRRTSDGMVVGEIGGAFIDDSTVEIGYAIVESQWGNGYATGAVTELLEHLRRIESAARVVAHTPLDRPSSGRVLEKAGFTNVGQVEDEHEGETLTVDEWELKLG